MTYLRILRRGRRLPTMKSYFTPYVTDKNPNRQLAIPTPHQISHGRFQDEYEIAIIGVHENPRHAEKDKILTMPTAIKKLPPHRQLEDRQPLRKTRSPWT
mgnify:CR=1 FL=1